MIKALVVISAVTGGPRVERWATQHKVPACRECLPVVSSSPNLPHFLSEPAGGGDEEVVDGGHLAAEGDEWAVVGIQVVHREKPGAGVEGFLQKGLGQLDAAERPVLALPPQSGSERSLASWWLLLDPPVARRDRQGLGCTPSRQLPESATSPQPVHPLRYLNCAAGTVLAVPVAMRRGTQVCACAPRVTLRLAGRGPVAEPGL